MKIIRNLFDKNSDGESTSLSEQMSSLEWIEATRDAALQLWRSSLMAWSESMPLAPKQIAEPHRKSIKQLVDEMPGKPSASHLEARKQKTTELLKSYGNQLGSYIDTQEREAKSVLTSVAQLTETLSGFDQRYAVRLQGITKKLRLLATSTDLTEIRTKLASEVTQLERCLEEQQRDTRSAVSRLTEEVSTSEQRKQRVLPGAGTQMISDSLISLEKAVTSWERFCLVRYEFKDRSGAPPDQNTWRTKSSALESAIPERMGIPTRVVFPRQGVLLAAVNCQLLEYAGQAESMEKGLANLTGLACASRVVEPLRGEGMREALARLEKAS